MRMEDHHEKVVINMTYSEAETLLANLCNLPIKIKDKKICRLIDLLDEYVNT